MTDVPRVPADEHFRRIGGEAGVRKLVDRFYDLMHSLPDAARVRALHPSSLDDSRDKLYWFLVGYLGGPPAYVSRFGHPRLRARHLPFEIGDAERDQWMMCMRRALEETVDDKMFVEVLSGAFARLADHMRNR